MGTKTTQVSKFVHHTPNYPQYKNTSTAKNKHIKSTSSSVAKKEEKKNRNKIKIQSSKKTRPKRVVKSFTVGRPVSEY